MIFIIAVNAVPWGRGLYVEHQQKVLEEAPAIGDVLPIQGTSELSLRIVGIDPYRYLGIVIVCGMTPSDQLIEVYGVPMTRSTRFGQEAYGVRYGLVIHRGPQNRGQTLIKEFKYSGYYPWKVEGDDTRRINQFNLQWEISTLPCERSF